MLYISVGHRSSQVVSFPYSRGHNPFDDSNDAAEDAQDHFSFDSLNKNSNFDFPGYDNAREETARVHETIYGFNNYGVPHVNIVEPPTKRVHRPRFVHRNDARSSPLRSKRPEFSGYEEETIEEPENVYYKPEPQRYDYEYTQPENDEKESDYEPDERDNIKANIYGRERYRAYPNERTPFRRGGYEEAVYGGYDRNRQSYPNYKESSRGSRQQDEDETMKEVDDAIKRDPDMKVMITKEGNKKPGKMHRMITMKKPGMKIVIEEVKGDGNQKKTMKKTNMKKGKNGEFSQKSESMEYSMVTNDDYGRADRENVKEQRGSSPNNNPNYGFPGFEFDDIDPISQPGPLRKVYSYMFSPRLVGTVHQDYYY